MLSGLWQRIHSPVEEKRLGGVLSPLRSIHQSLPVRRMFRAPFSFSVGEGRAAPFSAEDEARRLRLGGISSRAVERLKLPPPECDWRPNVQEPWAASGLRARRPVSSE